MAQTDFQVAKGLAARWMALLALVFSISVGTLTVVDHTLIAPRERKSSDLAKLDEVVIEIGKANATALALMNTNMGLNAARQMNSIKFPLLASAMTIVDRRREEVSADILLVLSGELIQIQNYSVALEYSTLAREVAGIEDTRIEAMRLMAVANMGECQEFQCPESQKLFEDALAQAKDVENHNSLWLISNVLRDWAIQAIFFGQCETASKILGRFADEVPLSIGRAPARFGFDAVLESADFVDICSREE